LKYLSCEPASYLNVPPKPEYRSSRYELVAQVRYGRALIVVWRGFLIAACLVLVGVAVALGLRRYGLLGGPHGLHRDLGRWSRQRIGFDLRYGSRRFYGRVRLCSRDRIGRELRRVNGRLAAKKAWRNARPSRLLHKNVQSRKCSRRPSNRSRRSWVRIPKPTFACTDTQLRTMVKTIVRRTSQLQRNVSRRLGRSVRS